MLFERKSNRHFGIKKVLIILVVLCLCILQTVFTYAWQSDNGDGTFTNPPLFADYPDPSIIRVGSDFYLATSTFAGVPGLVICKSQDLVNWEIAGHCISSYTGNAYNMQGGTKYGNGCFAPSIAYKNGTFYVVVTPNGESTRIYYAKDVAGPWSCNVLSGSYFDPALFIEDDGTAYIAYGGAWQNQISMIQLNSSLSATTGASRVILSYNNVEGAHLIKAKGKYYLFNAVPAQRLVCSRSNTLWGPYGETTTLCTAGKGGHQGGIVDLPDGSYWGYVHQDDGAIGRPTRICPITWENDWPKFGRPGYLGQIESKYTKPIANKPIKVPQASDEFNGSTLGLQWMWNHNPDNTKWSLTGSALRLKATTGKDFWNARNSLTQKGQGLISTGTIKIDCSQMQPGDIAGLGMLGDPRGYIAVTKDPKRIIMSEEESVKATVNNITSNILYFRIEMNFGNKQAKFFWKDDTRDWQQLGTTITMGFDWQYGTFQGEQYAILNFNPSGSSGYVDVDWFRLNDEPGPSGNQTPTPSLTPTATPTPGQISAFTQTEAESYNDQLGIQTEACSEGGEDVGYIENGDYIVYKNVDFGTGASNFQARVASGTSGGNIELRLDSINGTLVGTCPVTGSGDWQTWIDAMCNVSGASGTHDLYLKFTGGSGYLFNLNWWKFNAVSSPASTPTPTSTISIDVNHDGVINMADVILLAGGFNSVRGESRYVAAYDLNNDGAINISDVIIIAGNFNKIITPATPISATPTPTAKQTPTSTAAAKFHCFLLLGQSNMAGYAKTQASDKVEDPRVLVLGYDNNSALGRVTDQWDVACPPLHPAWLDAVGPGDWFGKSMIQKVPAGDTIGLIPCAISGEKIETFMKVGGTKYSWIINRAKLAQQKGGIIEGIIFHQGESNSGDPSWPGKVKTLVEDLRKDLNLGNVPFLPGELLYSGPCAGHNTLVNQLPSLITNCYVVSAQGLVQDPSDTTYRLHFSHDSSVELGKRYAEKMIQALGW